MAERRKKRKRPPFSSFSLIPEQSDGPRSEPSISSQMTEDESTSPSFAVEDESEAITFDAFIDELFQSESTAARVAPYHEKTPSGSLGGTESTSPSADSVAWNIPKFIHSRYSLWPGHDPWHSPLASYPLQKKQSAPLCSVPPLVSIKSEPFKFQRFSFNPQLTQSAPLRETDSTASSVSMKSDSSMYEPPSFNLQKKQESHFPISVDDPLRETDSTASHVSMKSDSSMYEPPSFKLKRKQSCSTCEEDVMDPVRLLCGHWSCRQCVCSFWYQYSSTADYPCKKCGKRFRGHQTDTGDDNKNLNLPSAPRPAPEDTTEPVRREKRDQVLQSVLLEKTIKRVEMETEKLQAEKEKFELEKRKLALEIQILEQKGKYTI